MSDNFLVLTTIVKMPGNCLNISAGFSNTCFTVVDQKEFQRIMCWTVDVNEIFPNEHSEEQKVQG